MNTKQGQNPILNTTSIPIGKEVVESDSDEEFPSGAESTDEEDGFHDALEGNRSIKVVKFGRNSKVVTQSTYGFLFLYFYHYLFYL